MGRKTENTTPFYVFPPFDFAQGRLLVRGKKTNPSIAFFGKWRGKYGGDFRKYSEIVQKTPLPVLASLFRSSWACRRIGRCPIRRRSTVVGAIWMIDYRNNRSQDEDGVKKGEVIIQRTLRNTLGSHYGTGKTGRSEPDN
jgi:hypothetical protein